LTRPRWRPSRPFHPAMLTPTAAWWTCSRKGTPTSRRCFLSPAWSLPRNDVRTGKHSTDWRQKYPRVNHSKGSEQTDPLQPLPTTSPCWMGFRIAPSNTSELIGWRFKYGEFTHRSNQTICSMGSMLTLTKNHGGLLVGGCSKRIRQ